MPIYISATGTLSGSSSGGYLLAGVPLSTRIAIGMEIVFLSGTNPFQSGTEVAGYYNAGGSWTIILSKRMVANGSFFYYLNSKLVGDQTIPDASSGTDVNYSRGMRRGPTGVWVTSSNPKWISGEQSFVSGHLYRINAISGVSAGTFGTLLSGTTNVFISNGTQISSVPSLFSINFTPLVSNGISDGMTRLASDSTFRNDISGYETLLPIYVGGSTSESNRIKLISPNSIVSASSVKYILSSGIITDFTAPRNAVRRTSSSNSVKCIFVIQGGGGGGAGGRDGSFKGAGGGGSGAFIVLKSSLPQDWIIARAGSGGLGRAINSTLSGGQGQSSYLESTATRFTEAGGGSGGSWSGGDGIGGSGGGSTLYVTDNIEGVANEFFYNSINGARGGNGNVASPGNATGFQAVTGTRAGTAPSSSLLSAQPWFFGNIYQNSSNAGVYYLWSVVGGSPTISLNRDGGTANSFPTLGNGGPGGGSAYAKGGNCETSMTAGSNGSGGAGGRSSVNANNRTAGTNGGNGHIFIFS
jgi:hypothetical protein